jgi:hypothetical protein
MADKLLNSGVREQSEEEEEIRVQKSLLKEFYQ